MPRPTLFFAHANGFPGGSYRKLLDELGGDFRIGVVDKVGHDPAYPVTDNWIELSQELIARIEASADAPVIGVGHSLGGVLTFKAAAHRPDLFRGFVMLDPPAFLGLRAWAMRLAKRYGFIDRVTPAGKTQGRRSHWPSLDTACESLRHKPLFRAFDPDCLRDYLSAGTVPTADGVRLAYDPAVEVAIFRTIPHTLPLYREPVRVPGALLCGEASQVIRRRDMRRLAERHRLGLHWIAGGHMFPLERPLETAAAIRRIVADFL